MSGEFDQQMHDQQTQNATLAGGPEMGTRLPGAKPSVRMSIWGVPQKGRREYFAGLRRLFSSGLWRKHLALKVSLVVLAFPAAAVILGYISRPPHGTARQSADADSANSSDAVTGERKAKPAPGKPFESKSEVPPPRMVPPSPVPTVPLQQPTDIMPVPPRPLAASAGTTVPPPIAAPLVPAPGASAKPPYTPVVYPARHDKHFGESCSGQLTLDSSGLQFKCLDDPSGSVQVGVNDIEAVDGNGIRLLSGKKYHFSIAGMAKSSEEQLFANWLGQVR